MKRIMHILLQWALSLTARMPFGILYVLSDIIYIMVFHVARYRRKVVEKNLAESFPDMDEDVLRKVEKQFYRNFADYIVETIKLMHISDRQMASRMTFDGIEHINNTVGKGRSVVCFFSHCGNWEWVTSITLHCKAEMEKGVRYCQVYRPLRDKWMDGLMLRLRSRFHSHSYPKRTVFRDLLLLSREGVPTVTGFMSDQKPSKGDNTHVLTFLNHPTAVITGTEALGRKLKMAAVYMDMYKRGRGRYHVTIRPIADDIAATEPMEVTDTYFRMLEQTIRRDPAIWLWTHKRWKHHVEMPKTPEE